jgi:hypothetical protein
LVISLGDNIHKEAFNNKQQLDKILEEVKKYTTNQDYIKEQNNQLIKEIRDIKIAIIRQPQDNIQEDIDKLTGAINKLNISDIKIEKKKPKPYTHWQPRK